MSFQTCEECLNCFAYIMIVYEVQNNTGPNWPLLYVEKKYILCFTEKKKRLYRLVQSSARA